MELQEHCIENEVLIFDESLNSIDVKLRDKIIKKIFKLYEKKLIILITQRLIKKKFSKIYKVKIREVLSKSNEKKNFRIYFVGSFERQKYVFKDLLQNLNKEIKNYYFIDLSYLIF